MINTTGETSEKDTSVAEPILLNRFGKYISCSYKKDKKYITVRIVIFR